MKTVAYHKSAVQYNDELADFAEDLAERLEDPEVAKWSRAVSKQHRHHSGRHQRALDRLEREAEAVSVSEDESVGAEAQDVDEATPEGIRSESLGVSVGPDTSQDAAPVANQGQEV